MAIPGPETGGILLVEGGKRAGLSLCREMLCQEIYAGRPVHWIDGGMSLDPSALIRPLSDRGRTPSSLSLLRTCRAFTAHQMHELVSRLERDLLVFEDGGDVRLVVLSDLASMFADSQVKKAEGIAMLESCLRVSKEVAEEKGLLVVITVVRRRSPPLPKTMISVMRGQADDRISLISYGGRADDCEAGLPRRDRAPTVQSGSLSEAERFHRRSPILQGSLHRAASGEPLLGQSER